MSVGTLTKAVLAHAKEMGTADGRVSSWVAYMMLSGLLQKVAQDEGGAAMTVKGGSLRCFSPGLMSFPACP
jgi:hypothetical protein